MSDQTNRFLKSHFPDLVLTPPLFYGWPFGLRFEVADWSLGEESVVLEKAGDRALKIVRYAFDSEDDILFVTDVYTQHEHELMKQKLLVYQKYADRQVCHRLRHERLTYVQSKLENREIYTQVSAARYSIAHAITSYMPRGFLQTESNLERKVWL
ncbi:hypothetical protein TM2_06500 [Bacillus altitudinis]|uniref:DUF3885 domain-containing protein n=1 Tax=Bacillus altitudinis TaxID=293387 RepID=UPI001F3B1ED5|nr:hypothetical protein [Bacillus altitudinis]BDC53981.1 hypothetical protein TM2_06500 [Bacillus altitudinis]